MFNRSRNLFVIVLIVLTLFTAACGGGGTDNSNPVTNCVGDTASFDACAPVAQDTGAAVESGYDSTMSALDKANTALFGSGE